MGNNPLHSELLTPDFAKQLHQKIDAEARQKFQAGQTYISQALVLQIDINGETFFRGAPPNTIKFRILNEDSLYTDLQLMSRKDRIAYPQNPGSKVRTGELVNVQFSNDTFGIAYWFPSSAVYRPIVKNIENEKEEYAKRTGVDLKDVQQTPYSQEEDFEKRVAAFISHKKNRIKLNIEDDEQGKEIVRAYLGYGPEASPVDDFPTFKKGHGDYAIEGYNNTLINLSHNRKNKPNSGYFNDAGEIQLIAGRKTENIDLKNDSAVITLSQKTNVDDNINLPLEEQKTQAQSAILIQSENLRFLFDFLRIFNKGLNCSLEITADGSLIIKQDDTLVTLKDNTISLKRGKAKIDIDEAGNIDFESYESITINSSNAFVKYNEMRDLFNGHIHLTPLGVSDGPIIPIDDNASTKQPV